MRYSEEEPYDATKKVNRLIKTTKMLFLLLVLMMIGLFYYFYYTMKNSSYFNYGTSSSSPIRVRINGANGNQYMATIPSNYLNMQSTFLKNIDKNSEVEEQNLWAIYPGFSGLDDQDISHPTRREKINFHFDLLNKLTSFSSDYLMDRYGQNGSMPLFNSNWKITHQLSKDQPFGNPVQYEIKWNPDQKDYIYSTNDHAVLIECSKSYCMAYKLIKNTTIIIYIGLKNEKEWIGNFNIIDKGIDSILDSFNIHESSSKRKSPIGFFNDCTPFDFDALFKSVIEIESNEHGKPFRNDKFFTELVSHYIPTNCKFDKIVERLHSKGFKEKSKITKGDDVEIALSINKSTNDYNITLEIKLYTQKDVVKSVFATVKK